MKDLKRDDAIFALVGNKTDLEEQRQVRESEAEALAKEKKFIFHEVSAKTGANINSLFYKDIFDQIILKFKVGGGPNQIEEDRQCIIIK